jgi:ADP-ribose pyrophosphatase YjhB (NUDIX family)
MTDTKRKFSSEAEFLANYDPSLFERPSVTADILIFSVSNSNAENWRKANKQLFSVLLVRRDDYPQIGKWNLPGGFIGINETASDATHRLLRSETGVIGDIYMEQLYTFDAPDRDPRTRVFSIAHMALINKNKLNYSGEHDAKWFTIEYNNGKLVLHNDDLVLTEQDLAFDHATIIKTGIKRLRNKIEYTDIVFDMMPEEFTLGELQQVYEIILGHKMIPAAFRRTIAKKVIPTGNIRSGAGHRPSVLFKRNRE